MYAACGEARTGGEEMVEKVPTALDERAVYRYHVAHKVNDGAACLDTPGERLLVWVIGWLQRGLSQRQYEPRSVESQASLVEVQLELVPLHRPALEYGIDQVGRRRRGSCREVKRQTPLKVPQLLVDPAHLGVRRWADADLQVVDLRHYADELVGLGKVVGIVIDGWYDAVDPVV